MTKCDHALGIFGFNGDDLVALLNFLQTGKFYQGNYLKHLFFFPVSFDSCQKTKQC